MKRLLAMGILLSLVLGLSAGVFADRVAAPDLPVALQTQVVSLGGLATKDSCDIWADDYLFDGNCYVWFWANIGMTTGVGFKKFLDPYGQYIDSPAYTSCPEEPSIFPFNVESMLLLLWSSNTRDIVIELDIEEPAFVDSAMHPCGFMPGEVIWTSGPITIHMEADPGTITLHCLHFIFPSIWVNGPFFISWQVLGGSQWNWEWEWGWCEDNEGIAHICTNWWITPTHDWWEYWYVDSWVHDIIFRADGRPHWNVAVDMGSFEAVPGDRMVTLNWRSVAEYNNAHWIVKRDEVKIAQVDGQGSKETSTDYTYVDRNVVNGVTYSYTIEAVNYEGVHDIYGPVTATIVAVPGQFSLAQNYPNPFNASTVIRYQLASDEHVTLKVYNVYGQEVTSLVDADQKAGMYSVRWTAEGVSSGMYIYTLTAGDFSQTKKMVFVK